MERSSGFRRWAWPVLMVAAALAVLWLVGLAFVFRTSPGWGFDFEAYLLAAHRLIDGASIYLPWTVAGPFQPGAYGLYLYSPPLAVAMLPFTAVSVPAATAIWFAMRAAVLVGGVALMPVQRWIRLLILVLAVFSEPVLTDLNLGNVSAVVMVLAVVAWRYLDRPPAAVATALVMAVRPTFGVFLISWLLRRSWRQAAICVATGAVLIVATIPFVGMSAYVDYFRLVRNLSGLTGVINNFDLGSTVARLGFGDTLSSAALIGGYVTAIVATVVSLRRDREVGFMVTLGATLLLSPLLQDHFLISALLPIAFLLERGRAWLAIGMAALLVVGGPWVVLLALIATIGTLLAPAKSDEPYAPASKRSTAPA